MPADTDDILDAIPPDETRPQRMAREHKEKLRAAAAAQSVDVIIQPAGTRKITSGTWAKNHAAQIEQERIRMLRDQMAEGMPDVIAKLIEMAKGGDVAAGRVLVERSIPIPKPVEQPIKLSFNIDEVADRAEAVLRSVVNGEIGVDSGSKLLAAMAQVQTARLEMEFNERVKALEAKAASMAGVTRADMQTLRIPSAGANGSNGGH